MTSKKCKQNIKVVHVHLFISTTCYPVVTLIFCHTIECTLYYNFWILNCLKYVIMTFQIVLNVAKAEFYWHIVWAVWWQEDC